MNMFQWLTISILGVLVLSEIVGKLRGRRSGWVWMVRLTLWVAAIIGIRDPEIVSHVAVRLGIQRGADLVSYMFALAFLATTFYFYSRYTALQQQITLLVRHLAIAEAQRGVAPSPASNQTPE